MGASNGEIGNDVPEVLNMALALEQVGGDGSLLNDILRIFMEDAPRRLVDLREALQGEDREVFRRTAHTIKGAAATIAATRVQELAATIEQLADDDDLAIAGEYIEDIGIEIEILVWAIMRAVDS